MKTASNMSTNSSVLVPRIETRIRVIRGLRVKRNRDRFPSDFLFQLTLDEKTEVVANFDNLQSLKFSKALPFPFTEHGAIQAVTFHQSARLPLATLRGLGCIAD